MTVHPQSWNNAVWWCVVCPCAGVVAHVRLLSSPGVLCGCALRSAIAQYAIDGRHTWYGGSCADACRNWKQKEYSKYKLPIYLTILSQQILCNFCHCLSMFQNVVLQNYVTICIIFKNYLCVIFCKGNNNTMGNFGTIGQVVTEKPNCYHLAYPKVL